MSLKLFINPGACSLAPHIVLRELGKNFELQFVDMHGKPEDAESYRKVNIKGVVPSLQLENGEILTENLAVTQYIGFGSSSSLFPEFGTLKYFRFLEWFAFFNTDLHHTYGKLFYPLPDDEKVLIISKLEKFYTIIEQALSQNKYLTGNTITAADIYLFVLSTWPAMFNKFPNFVKYFNEILEREKVQEAIKAEGIIVTPY